ncbi:MAG: PAS domain-containing protein, partial [bacterium]
ILFLLMFKMISKEEQILFPVAVESLSADEWEEISKHSAEVGYAFIEPEEAGIYKANQGESRESETIEGKIGEGVTGSKRNVPKDQIAGKKPGSFSGKDFYGVEDLSLKDENIAAGGVLIGLGTGVLNIEQLILILNSLPVDITYVDKNDRVKYYSNPADRTFPRSPAIIGRSVQNCHPPESVHIVEKILSAFKEGEKDTASFWIKMKGRYIMIQYFALRDNNGEYQGTLEVGQDITDITKIEGEKRLLDWEE